MALSWELEALQKILEEIWQDACIETCDPSLRSDQAKQPFVPI